MDQFKLEGQLISKFRPAACSNAEMPPEEKLWNYNKAWDMEHGTRWNKERDAENIWHPLDELTFDPIPTHPFATQTMYENASKQQMSRPSIH